jgi:hypothetical protein
MLAVVVASTLLHYISVREAGLTGRQYLDEVHIDRWWQNMMHWTRRGVHWFDPSCTSLPFR